MNVGDSLLVVVWGNPVEGFQFVLPVEDVTDLEPDVIQARAGDQPWWVMSIPVESLAQQTTDEPA